MRTLKLTPGESYKPFDKFYEMIYKKVNNGNKLPKTTSINKQKVFATPDILQEIFNFYDAEMGAEMDEIDLLFSQYSPIEYYFYKIGNYTVILQKGWCEE